MIKLKRKNICYFLPLRLKNLLLVEKNSLEYFTPLSICNWLCQYHNPSTLFFRSLVGKKILAENDVPAYIRSL